MSPPGAWPPTRSKASSRSSQLAPGRVRRGLHHPQVEGSPGKCGPDHGYAPRPDRGNAPRRRSDGEWARLLDVRGRRLPRLRFNGMSGFGEGVQPLLELRGVHTPGEGGMPGLQDIDLTILPGEIVGVAGVSGNGQRELGDVVLGLERCSRGSKVPVGAGCDPLVGGPDPRQRSGLHSGGSVGHGGLSLADRSGEHGSRGHAPVLPDREGSHGLGGSSCRS